MSERKYFAVFNKNLLESSTCNYHVSLFPFLPCQHCILVISCEVFLPKYRISDLYLLQRETSPRCASRPTIDDSKWRKLVGTISKLQRYLKKRHSLGYKLNLTLLICLVCRSIALKIVRIDSKWRRRVGYFEITKLFKKSNNFW